MNAATRNEKVNILLVDDQPSRLLSYEAILAELGQNLVSVTSGTQALRKLMENEFAVILLDVNMPGMDGFETATMIHQHPRFEKTPIIFVTAVHVTDLDRLKGYKLGAVDYVYVPVVPEILRSKVMVLVELYQQRRQLRLLNADLERANELLRAEKARELERMNATLARANAELAGANQSLQTEIRERRRTEERLRIALNTGRLGAFELDVASGDLVCTEQTRANFGRAPDERFGYDEFWEAVHPDDRAMVGEALAAATGGHEDFDAEYRCVWPDGSVHWIIARGRVVESATSPRSMIGVTLDITDRKQMEEALRESEARMRFLADAIPSIVWTAGADFRVTYANRHWEAYYGMPPGGGPGELVDRLLHPEDASRLRDTIVTRLREGVALEFEGRHRRHDGEYRWFLTRAVPFRDGNGVVAAWFGVTTDIDEQKSLQDRLLEADRRKDEFLATLAHELRNPLAPMQNALNVLELAHGERERAARAEAILRRQLSHMVRLVDDLLDVSRITRGKLELRRQPVALDAVLASALETTRPLIEEAGHRLELHLPASGVVLDADPQRLAQVFANLLNNAAKYTEPGGRIEVRAEADGERVEVRVRDNGLGIPPAFLDRVFELFSQADTSLERARGGLGIGLTLVHRLVAMHGGAIEARSEGLGRGSEFVVRLPVAADLARPAEAADLESAASAARRVLVVDDNRDAADTLALSLTLLGHEVRAIYDPLEVVATAERFRPEIVFMDVGMPRLNGYDVARALRAHEWSEPMVLVALTGWGQDEDRRRSREAGFDHHLTKPAVLPEIERLCALGEEGRQRVVA